MKVAITGSSGFIGTHLTEKLASMDVSVLALDHHLPKRENPNVTFFQTDLIHDIPIEEYLSCDAVIHLAGLNIFNRWSDECKKLIIQSRIDTANALIEVVEKNERGPKIFISASAIGYYGHAGERELDENSPKGDDFLASVCAEWECILKRAQDCGMRTVSVRTGIVLGSGGILRKLSAIFKWGLGGTLGNGSQWFSWIFIEDLLNVYCAVLFDQTYTGPVNAVSPNPIRNRDFVKAIGSALHRPAILPIPTFFIKLILGELGNVLLASQKVIPKKLLEKKFVFKEPEIESAIRRSLSI